jgi:LuxR family maltose regulon positive regulatory protein
VARITPVAYSPLKASTPSIPRTSWANEMPARLILTPPGAVLPGEIVWRIPDPAIAAPQADLWRDCRCAEAGAIPGISVSTVRWPWRRPYGGVMEVRLFGELEALTGGVPVPVRGAKQRTLLALLALQRGQPVSAGRLIDLLWDSGQAANPANALQTQISQLRRTLGPAAILTTEAGYALAVGPGEVDVVRFEQLVATGRRLAADGELAPASATLAEALRLRRGEPLAEFTNAAFFDAERAHLDELTLLAIESRAGADLGLGHYGELAGELEALCWEHPLRERLRELHIRALYQSGRQAEALRAYTEIRDRLVNELGIDPGPALRELQARILAQDPSIGPASAPAEPAPLAAPPEAAGNSAKLAPLLETKLYVPHSRRGLVPRPRLSERLDRGTASKLTLISAPAGFGKTTLLTEWLAAGPARPAAERLVAWLSLDQADNDPVSFWTYVIAALRTAASGVGESALAYLQAPQPPPIETVLTVLLNDLGAMAEEIVLVLDDYHVIDAGDVQDAMAFLLDHLPPRLHVVIASRADPALPLPRWRARGELIETRAAELRFTPGEAAVYLNEMMGLRLTARDVAALEGRTEGWIAALQLAALSMQGRDDVAGFIAGFAGDDRYVVDYLAEEVLQRQPDRVQAFLLQTCILGRLSGPLCDAVTGEGDGKAMLETLDRGNLFLVPLDDRRRWYRYHHLFADVLRARLLDERPGQVPELHRRASAWFQRSGEPAVAIDHALAAGDFGRAADLIERAIPVMRKTRQEGTVHSWLKALPDEVVRARPMLSFAVAGALLTGGEPGEVEARLRDAERWLTPAAAGTGSPARAAEMVVADEDEYRRLPGAIELYRAALALIQGDVPGTVAHARRTLDLALAEDHGVRAGAAGFLGLAFWTSGDLETAHSAWAECAAGLRRAGQIADTFGCAIAMADIRLAQGRLAEAMRTYEQALQRASEQDGPVLRGTADMYVGMSEIHREYDDLQAATQWLLRSQELGEHVGLPQNPYRRRVAMARIRQAEGDLAGALDLLNEAERLYVGDFFPNVRPVPALKAQVTIAQGRLGEALSWVREQGLSADDNLSYLREFEHITLARVLLAQRADPEVHEAARLLERLLQAAEEGGRTGRVIEILVLLALTRQRLGDLPAALACLARAVTLAEPEGYIRVFADAGPPMAWLLRALAKQRTAGNYVRRLLAAVGDTKPDRPVKQALIEPLSERELDVLRLLGTDLNGPAIASELMVSLNTIRTHTKNIYAKLAVTSRRAAVRRAAELGLPRTRNQ